MINKYIIFSFILCFLISCGGDSKSSSKATASKATTAGPSYKNLEALPSIDKEIMMELWNNCDYTDYIFHELPFALSQDDSNSIKQNLSYFSLEPNPWIPKGCKPMARQMFHIKGEIVKEVDVYYTKECKFYVFVEKEKPYAANLMSADGIQFFENMIAQASNANPNK